MGITVELIVCVTNGGGEETTAIMCINVELPTISQLQEQMDILTDQGGGLRAVRTAGQQGKTYVACHLLGSIHI